MPKRKTHISNLIEHAANKGNTYTMDMSIMNIYGKHMGSDSTSKNKDTNKSNRNTYAWNTK
eukprot:6348951-Pyramimonas_sp.AAC.1